ncbi:hypothetical protein E2C01_069454 [Portunus trituberculatus]|uniref:Uncharacterized protein n=1 Tax=Portunus trituberculatus TaxID=210409 RepID=A0A5B7HRL6_PORTR|nr:hypothetical protein [Portunus trituberculatus]
MSQQQQQHHQVVRQSTSTQQTTSNVMQQQSRVQQQSQMQTRTVRQGRVLQPSLQHFSGSRSGAADEGAAGESQGQGAGRCGTVRGADKCTEPGSTPLPLPSAPPHPHRHVPKIPRALSRRPAPSPAQRLYRMSPDAKGSDRGIRHEAIVYDGKRQTCVPALRPSLRWSPVETRKD